MMYRKLSIILLSFFLCLNSASVPPPVGHIESFDGPPAAYVLKRYGKSQPVRIFMPLFSGDIIMLKDRRYRMTLRLGELNIVHLDRSRLVHEVKKAGKPPALSSALLRVFAEGINALLYGIKETPVSVATPRGRRKLEPLFIPLLQWEKAYFAAGERELFLMWEGGMQPYQVHVYRNGTLLLKQQSSGNQARFAKQKFLVGEKYRVEIKSAQRCETKAQNPAQCMADGEFLAVPPARQPAMPEELQQSGLPEIVKQTLFGIWLCRADNNPMNEWDLEAYQKIAAGKEAGNDLAALLAEKGRW
ncbi:MAG: hypothetical protein GY862_20275 [Gammaproteobacteria bacterium]|nr:hypothetical protein [Gammaproteobacteria bacterium]